MHEVGICFVCHYPKFYRPLIWFVSTQMQKPHDLTCGLGIAVYRPLYCAAEAAEAAVGVSVLATALMRCSFGAKPQT